MRSLLLSGCILILTVLVSAPGHVQGAETARLEGLWLLDSGINPCRNLQSRCSHTRYFIYERIIKARERGDDQAAERWLNILRWDYRDDRDDSRR